MTMSFLAVILEPLYLSIIVRGQTLRLIILDRRVVKPMMAWKRTDHACGLWKPITFLADCLWSRMAIRSKFGIDWKREGKGKDGHCRLFHRV